MACTREIGEFVPGHSRQSISRFGSRWSIVFYQDSGEMLSISQFCLLEIVNLFFDFVVKTSLSTFIK